MPVNSLQFGQEPWKYLNGLKISNDGTTPDEIIDIAVGSCLDSTGVYQIEVDAALEVSNIVSGIGGLDTGSVAANTLYKVYLVADPVKLQPVGAVISVSATAPSLPAGYSIFRLIGYVATDATSDFLLGFWTAGNSSARLFMYDAPQATTITAGGATSYTAVSLAAFVPAVDNTPVWIAYDMTPAAASRIMSLQPFGAVGDAFKATSQVTAVHLTGNALVLAKLNSGAPSIEYAWSAGGGDAVALNVAGYEWFS